MWSLYPQSTFVHLSGKTVCDKTVLVLEPHTCCKYVSPICHCQVFRREEALLLVWALTIFHPSCWRYPWLIAWLGSEFNCISTTVEIWGSWDCSTCENNLPISCSFFWILHSLFTSSSSSFTQLIDSSTIFAKGIIVSPSLIESHHTLLLTWDLVSYITSRRSGWLEASGMAGAVIQAAVGKWALWHIKTIPERAGKMRWKEPLVTSFTGYWVCSLTLLVDKKGWRSLTAQLKNNITYRIYKKLNFFS